MSLSFMFSIHPSLHTPKGDIAAAKCLSLMAIALFIATYVHYGRPGASARWPAKNSRLKAWRPQRPSSGTCSRDYSYDDDPTDETHTYAVGDRTRPAHHPCPLARRPQPRSDCAARAAIRHRDAD